MKYKTIAWVFGAIIIIGGGITAVKLTRPQSSTEFQVYEDKVYEDSLLTIYSTAKLDLNTVTSLFNDKPAIVSSVSSNKIIVKIPEMEILSADHTTSDHIVSVTLTLVNSSGNLYTKNLTYIRRIKITEVIANSTEGKISLIGKNLNDEQLKVYFNDKEAITSSKSDTMLVVNYPDLTNAPNGFGINLSVQNKDSTIFLKKYFVKNVIINLIDIAKSAVWKSGVLSTDGYNYTPTTTNNLVWQGSETDILGFVRDDVVKLEDGKNYRSLRTHPKWVNQGSMSGYYKPMHLIGKKIFDSKVGFLRGAQFSGGVTFEVWLHYLASNVNQHRKLTSIWTKSYGKIQELKNNFPTDVPADFSIELRVNADDDSMSDWATWVSPVITTKVLQPKFKIKLIPIDSAIKVESIN